MLCVIPCHILKVKSVLICGLHPLGIHNVTNILPQRHQRHQMLCLPRKATLMIDPRHTWNQKPANTICKQTNEPGPTKATPTFPCRFFFRGGEFLPLLLLFPQLPDAEENMWFVIRRSATEQPTEEKPLTHVYQRVKTVCAKFTNCICMFFQYFPDVSVIMFLMFAGIVLTFTFGSHWLCIFDPGFFDFCIYGGFWFLAFVYYCIVAHSSIF